MSDWRIEPGDVLERLREMPMGSVHCVVTSPPYFGLRDYGIPGQIGLEATPEAFIARMVEVFREVRRVLRHDGTCWVNMGDSYATVRGGENPDKQYGDGAYERRNAYMQSGTRDDPTKQVQRRDTGLKPKDLMMMPARLALALQSDGWWIRSEITWCKRAPMPESVTDRPTSATEKIYLLTKAKSYYYDADAVREPVQASTIAKGGYDANGKSAWPENRAATPQDMNRAAFSGNMLPGKRVSINPAGANMRNFWLLSPEPYAAAHFATFPTEIPRRAILAGTSERGACAECGAPWRRVVERGALVDVSGDHKTPLGSTNGSKFAGKSSTDGGWLVDRGLRAGWQYEQRTTGWQPTCRHTDAPTVPCTVLDPFSGAGTTIMVALRLGRRGVGIELNPEYVAMSRERIIGDAPMFNTPLEQSA